MNNRFPIAWLALIGICGALSGGCRPSGDERAIVAYSELTGVRKSHHRGLTDELARLEAESATPLQLQSQRRADLPRERNAADLLLRILSAPAEKRLREQLEPLRTCFLHPTPGERRTLLRMVDQHHVTCAAIHAALVQPECQFPLRFDHGWLNDASWLDATEALAHLQLLAAASQWHQNDAMRALEQLRDVMRVVDLLSAEPWLMARVLAARLRWSALALIEQIGCDPRTDGEVIAGLAQMLELQLENWPDDDRALIGERAMGMHAFEMVRDGHLASLLTRHDMLQFHDRERLLDSLLEVTRQVDDDEHYYLQVMRRIIDAGSRPGGERERLLQDLIAELQADSNADPHHRVSRLILLADLPSSLQCLARDRGACESTLDRLRAIPATDNNGDDARSARRSDTEYR
jgi:hypothetical protein